MIPWGPKPAEVGGLQVGLGRLGVFGAKALLLHENPMPRVPKCLGCFSWMACFRYLEMFWVVWRGFWNQRRHLSKTPELLPLFKKNTRKNRSSKASYRDSHRSIPSKHVRLTSEASDGWAPSLHDICWSSATSCRSGNSSARPRSGSSPKGHCQ